MIDVSCDRHVSRQDPPPPNPSRQRNKLDPKARDQFQRGQARGCSGGDGLWGACPGLSVTGRQKIEARPYGDWERRRPQRCSRKGLLQVSKHSAGALRVPTSCVRACMCLCVCVCVKVIAQASLPLQVAVRVEEHVNQSYFDCFESLCLVHGTHAYTTTFALAASLPATPARSAPLPHCLNFLNQPPLLPSSSRREWKAG